MSTTIITTTTITQTSEPCSLNFTEPEGNIEILQQLDSRVECNYLITVYLGYGIEVQSGQAREDANITTMRWERLTNDNRVGQPTNQGELDFIRNIGAQQWSCRRDSMVEVRVPVLAAGCRYGRESSLQQTDQQLARLKEGNWVLNVSVLEGERVTVEDTGGREPFILANETVLMRGLVLRSWSNQISLRFRSDQQHNSGFLLLHYQVPRILIHSEYQSLIGGDFDVKQCLYADSSHPYLVECARANSRGSIIGVELNDDSEGSAQITQGDAEMGTDAFVLSCAFPKEPAGGEVSVTHLHAGGEAYFSCFTGYKLQGPKMLTCRNATTPYWSGKEPQCVASCGGMIKNATYGRIVSPGFPGNYSNNLTCHWVLEVPEGHRLHIHFEKVALAEDDDRLLIKNGNNIDSPPVYDSYEVEYLPNEGVLSTGRYLFIEFTTDGTVTSTAFAIGMCYEPFVKYGNFSSSDSTYGVAAVVEFSCDPGYTLEQGSVVIECVDAQNPQWNETEPACRAVCSGEITDSAGVVLSPNWPEAYDKGQDCIWGIHVEEDKRIMLDIQV
ncbi:unnamed protein product [Pleuronectes platessa]|uniref:Uncharacterized protein n=1 Tax=Pleuronectes platessa TaxID=8262 RepID=A0A9N7TVH6_PLEPL|nr:unnamed protein product [Pleuronectes platessa]